MRRPPKRPDGRKPARSAGTAASRGPASRSGHSGEDARKPARGRAEREAEEPRRPARGRAERIGEATRKPARSERGADAPAKPARGRAERFADDARKPARPRLDRNADAPPRSGRGRPDRRGEEPRRSAQGRAEPVPAPPELAPEPPRPGAGAGSGAYWIYGHHAVLAALSNPRRKPRRLLTTTDAEIALRDSFDGPWRVTPERADRARFQTFLTEDAVHQGIALLAEPLEAFDLEDAIAASEGPVLLLDQVTDPRNVGAALRAAAAFGAAAVVMQDRHAPHETGTLARAASGTLDIVPVVREVNLSRAIATLQKAGFWVLGLAGEGKRTLAEAVPRDRRVALVLGGEEAGLRRLQRETCDELVRLPMAEGVESLNVSTAAAVALYEIVRR
ncbi:23S rRNA (guanosine(2251)-2'-O)-methyltransferase RlmB [Roseomonas terrae]|uniref:23S rRNA (Guanosine(2251)-2'-O)-methyltransferase RlmB n=1 Tax=Neoroseomonas terrae TaxID=424799 RepID=A0ABS5EQW0_9PROT|nr:23S rRNA (guanosine(2251)-2'-O)-methyltransferase RlmB [Neoroseomonas terrae]